MSVQHASIRRDPPIDPAKVDKVRIFPPIGIARVGNSVDPNGWFVGPEVPGRFDEPDGGFKDGRQAVKRQAARFRVYAFDANNKVLGEVNSATGFGLEWSLEVANQKPAWYAFMGSQQDGAFQPGYTTLRNPLVQPDKPPSERDKLIIRSGVKHLDTPRLGPVPLVGDFYGSKDKPTKVYLGEARTDNDGRLLVLAGRGFSRSIADPNNPYPLIMTDFDSPDWIDDTSDGYIQVTAKHIESGHKFKAPNKARVIGTTPKFANGIYAPTSLYDLMEEVYEQQKRAEQGAQYEVGDVSWSNDIWPILQRPPLISWVNIQADGGHGPNAFGNFFDPKWQASLSDNSDASKAIRQGVLGRLRLPLTAGGKYTQARNGQAFPYFMPWLSGDNGRTTAGDPTTFASLTELQYDRLAKWSRGEFDTTSILPPTPPESIDDLPLQLRPALLTKAALEPTIGAPLYPGIEMSWNAEKAETYDLTVPFTIAEDVEPGDLTKYLSLPWQSDFYMCRSYWWPSVRPDTIVTEQEYERVAKSVKPEDIAKLLTHRVPWERGLHQNYTDQYGDQPLFANTDMAQRWDQLGFIVRRPSGSDQPIFVETERGKLDSLLANIAPPTQNFPYGGGYKLPKKGPNDGCPIQTLASLQEHLQTAMAVELSTIPLYLYGMYSVKTPDAYVNDPRYYNPITGAVRGVVAEEMLHLSLAGNILLAIGGKPKLYDPHIIPSYPMLMEGRVPPLKLHLRKMTKKNLETFIQVEKPEPPHARPESDKYHTLGQFYDAIKQGLNFLNKKEKHLFHPDTAPYQFAPGLGYQPQVRDAGGSVIVTDIETAMKAITTIVNQGEGNPRPFDDDDHLEKDHYDIFQDLQIGEATWDVYPVREDPTTVGYWKEDKRIYQVSLTFDAVYCFLLLTIEKLWTIKSDDERHKLVLGNMFSIMMGILAPLAKFLLTQPIGDPKKGEVAGPCFGYYRFDHRESALKQVQQEMQTAINAYVDVTEETEDQVAVHNYGQQLEALLPIQNSVNALLDLDSYKKLAEPVVKKVQPGVQCTGAKGFARGF